MYNLSIKQLVDKDVDFKINHNRKRNPFSNEIRRRYNEIFPDSPKYVRLGSSPDSGLIAGKYPKGSLSQPASPSLLP